MAGSTEIVVDAERKLGRISKFIYGQNIEPATSNQVFGPKEISIRKDVIEAAGRIRIPIIRWPGGNFASQYHWEDGVGPKRGRPVTYDLAWGGLESNQFGSEEFIKYCRLIGAEPFITVNAGSGTAEEAAHWVEYFNLKKCPAKTQFRGFNEEYYKQISGSRYVKLREEYGHPEPYNVKYWSIGNETWGDFQVGNLSAEENAEKTAEYAKLMKRVDPDIKIAAVGMYLSSYWKWRENQDCRTSMEWNTEVLKTAGELVDYISVHRYYFPEVGEGSGGFSKDKYLPLLACPIHSEKKLKVVNSTIDLAMDILKKDERIKISFDEWYLGVHTLSHALATARFFNVLQRMAGSVAIACGEQWIATVMEKDILVEAGHRAFDLYENHSGEIALDTIVHTETYDTKIQEYQEWNPTRLNIAPESFRRVPYIDSSATLSVDRKKLYIATVNAFMNKGEECKIRLRDISVKKKVRIYELNGPDIMAYNDAQNPNRVGIMEKKINNANNIFTYEFPPHSATIMELQIQ
jgi:alpha-N-arabinofuranosidase